jgi:hypothetical protein
MNADQDRMATLFVRSSDALIQFDKIVAFTHHNDAETGATKQFLHTLRGIQGQILLTLKRI